MYQILLAFSLLAFSIGCSKPKCKGDCADIQITGQVVDSSNNRGVGSVPIQVYWETGGFACVLCSKIFVASTKTDNDGNFNFTATVDKAMFANNYLTVEAQCPINYMGYSPKENRITKTLSQYVPGTNNLRMVMYRKASLTIALQNTQNDTFQHFTLSYRYSNTELGLISLQTPPFSNVVEVQTAADIYTKINWRKNYGPGNIYYADSIKCSANGSNTFTLNY